jgi:hypothetical protein
MSICHRLEGLDLRTQRFRSIDAELETQCSPIDASFGRTTNKVRQRKIDYVPFGIECVGSVRNHTVAELLIKIQPSRFFFKKKAAHRYEHQRSDSIPSEKLQSGGVFDKRCTGW